MHMNSAYHINTNSKPFKENKNNVTFIKMLKQPVKLSQQLSVRDYSFADFTTLDTYIAFKIASRRRTEVCLQGYLKSPAVSWRITSASAEE